MIYTVNGTPLSKQLSSGFCWTRRYEGALILLAGLKTADAQRAVEQKGVVLHLVPVNRTVTPGGAATPRGQVFVNVYRQPHDMDGGEMGVETVWKGRSGPVVFVK